MVRVDGRSTATRLGGHVLQGELFDDGGETRGFLREGVSVEEVAAEFDSGEPDAVDPTYPDMFNYYVHLSETAPE